VSSSPAWELFLPWATRSRKFGSAFLRGDSGIHALTLFDTERFKVKFGGEIVGWAPGEEYLSAKENRRIDRFTQFCARGRIDAARQSGIDFAKEDRSAAA